KRWWSLERPYPAELERFCCLQEPSRIPPESPPLMKLDLLPVPGCHLPSHHAPCVRTVISVSSEHPGAPPGNSPSAGMLWAPRPRFQMKNEFTSNKNSISSELFSPLLCLHLKQAKRSLFPVPSSWF
ncbi:mCG146119, partial [Mus musculus]